MKKLAELWEPYGDPEQKKARCLVCSHYCIISPGKRGWCRIRENNDGELYLLVYGMAINRGSNDPVEKKPLYHFYPGSNAYSIATIGCNFHCQFCQNWEISQSCPDGDGKKGDFTGKDADIGSPVPLVNITPEEVIKRAKAAGSTSIAYTYTEPTIWFEFVRDTALLAHDAGLKNILVSNGYSSPESNAEFVKFIDANNIDFKAFNDDFYKRLTGVPSMQPILDTAVFQKQNGVHIEITNLIIPEENDNLEEIRSMVKWIIENLGPDTPLHFSAYHPDYRLNRPATPTKILLEAWNIAKEEGLYFAYMGNVRGDDGSDTLCRNCGVILIERHGYAIKNKNLTEDSKCKKCGSDSYIIGQFINADRPFFI
jgi:pyruvate formate lyase activating enzyme